MKRKAFTITELLVVIAIIAVLLGIALPALNQAKKSAKVMAERSTLSNMELAIEAFKNDHGYYPESVPRTNLLEEFQGGPGPEDQGAHRLAEALLGLDLLGYEENHYYKVEDGSITGTLPEGTPLVWSDGAGGFVEAKRHGPYMDSSDVKVGTMGRNVRSGDVPAAHPGSTNFPDGVSNPNYVFLDNLEYDQPRPILYYRARRSGRSLGTIYDYSHNAEITMDVFGGGLSYPTFDDPTGYEFGYFIWDPRTGPVDEPTARPHNKDTFLLIGAGFDHVYGTEDDITNFPVEMDK